MRIASLSLVTLLGLGGSFYALEAAIAPPIAQAYTSRVNITLERQPNESYETLTRRAEAVARAAAQRSFDNDILATQAAVVVTAQNSGLSAPILTLQVSRDKWKNYPDAQRWSTYYPNSQALLRIDPVAVGPLNGQPPTNPANGTGTGTQPSTPATSPGSVTNPANGTGTGTQPSTPATTSPGSTPGNRTGNTGSGNQGTNGAATNNGRSPANRTGAANQGTNGASTNNGRSPANRTGAANQGTNGAATNNGRSSTNSTNRTGTSNAQRSNPASRRTSPTNQRTNRPSNSTQRATTRTNNAPANRTSGTATQRTNQNTQPTTNRSRATYGTGVIRRARELRQELNNRPAPNLPQD